MNELSYSSILVALTNFFTAIILFSRSKGSKHAIIWGIFCLTIVFWGIGGYWASIAKDKNIAYRGWQIANVTSIFAPVVYCHFVSSFLNLKRKSLLFVSYSLAVLFFSVNVFARENFLGDLIFVFNQFYYINWDKHVNPLYIICYIIFYWGLLPYAFFELLIGFSNSKFNRKNKIKYFILGTSIGWLGAHGDFLSVFNHGIYPHLNFLCGMYTIIIGYAIIKYRLLDISLAITRFGIFIVIYSLVLGIPFAIVFGWREQLKALSGEQWWLVPLISSTVLATAGPFIYLYFNKKAEDALLREQKSYQNVLLGASSGMIRIKDIKRLLNLIVHVVTKSVKIKHAAVYLLDTENNGFGLQAARGWDGKKETFISADSFLIRYLTEKKEAIVAEEEAMRSREEQHNPQLTQLVEQLSRLGAALAVPSFMDNKLTGLLILGEKLSKKLYSQDDINVFSVLANQAALAIENAQFYDEVRRTHEQLFQAEKLATIGTMADGLSHQINNRFHALSLIAGDALDVIRTLDGADCGDRTKEALCDVRGALERIETNVMQGGEVVKGLLKYSRPDEAGSEPVDLISVLNGAIEMVQYKIKLKEIDLVQDIPGDLPSFNGNLTQLQEVFFNLIDNAYDAIKERQMTLKEPGYKGRIEIAAREEGGNLKINVRDNGIGVKDLDRKKLFTPFFTTKATAKKGTGLGLYVIEKIIAMHNGTIALDSVYQKGTHFTLTLPLTAQFLKP